MRRALALAGALAVLAAGGVATALPADAAAEHVGVVVRYGDGRVSAGCATVGGTGLDLLRQHHAVQLGTQQYSGFVLQVDTIGTTHPDDTHYWSYWHSGGNGGWTYASSGSASYHPKAGTVEGWSYVDGQGSAPRPPARTYAALCGHLDPHATPHPTPTPASTHPTAVAPAPPTRARPTPRTSTAAPVHHHAEHTAVTRAAAPTAGPMRTTTTAPPGAARSAETSRHHHPAGTTSPRQASPPAHSSAAGSSAAAPAAPSSAAPTIAAQPAADTSTTSAWPAVGALAVVVALALTAWLVMRRRAG